jgi:hypothetical protein
MLGKDLLRFLRQPVRSAAALMSDPLEAWTAFQDRLAARSEDPMPSNYYDADHNWERRLHNLLEAPWPCEMTSEFWTLWRQVIEELKAKGIRVGPESFKGWNDGDAGLVRAIWCLTLHLRPRNVVETGVAHGLTSRFILEGLAKNAAGHLWSIDRPPFEQTWHKQIGAAVESRLLHQWSYVRGSSRLRLPEVLSQIGRIDLFIHDSLHSERNVRFEIDQAWAALRPGGAIVVDDIDVNRAFRNFVQSYAGHSSIICEAEPLRPDVRRFNKKGLFGIIFKNPSIQSKD